MLYPRRYGKMCTRKSRSLRLWHWAVGLRRNTHNWVASQALVGPSFIFARLSVALWRRQRCNGTDSQRSHKLDLSDVVVCQGCCIVYLRLCEVSLRCQNIEVSAETKFITLFGET